jgi:hypothetical protein
MYIANSTLTLTEEVQSDTRLLVIYSETESLFQSTALVVSDRDDLISSTWYVLYIIYYDSYVRSSILGV